MFFSVDLSWLIESVTSWLEEVTCQLDYPYMNVSLTFCPTDYIQHIGSTLASLSPCSIPQRLYRQAQSLLRSLLPWSNIASKTGIQYSRTMWYIMVGGSCVDSSCFLFSSFIDQRVSDFVFLFRLSFSGAHVFHFSSVFLCVHEYTHSHILDHKRLSTPCV